MENVLVHFSINILLVVISMIWVNWNLIKNSDEFMSSIRGKDKILQVNEICIYIWIRIVPLIVLSDLFLDKTIEPQAWYSLDGVFFVLIAGNLGHKYLENKKQD